MPISVISFSANSAFLCIYYLVHTLKSSGRRPRSHYKLLKELKTSTISPYHFIFILNVPQKMSDVNVKAHKRRHSMPGQLAQLNSIHVA